MRLIAVAMTTLAFVSVGMAAPRPPLQRGGPPGRGPGGGSGGGPDAPDLEILKKFDKDKTGRLNTRQREAARKWLKSQGTRGFGGPPGGGPGGGGPGGGRDRGGVSGSPGPKVSPTDVTNYPNKKLYDTEIVRTIFLTFENDDWEAELETFKPTDVEVPATLLVDGKTYDDVGVGFRGSSSFFRISAGSKRSFNISIDYANEDQRLYGVKTLNLLNCNGDASLMSSLLYHAISSKQIATPRANFVKVVVNGRSWGIYANVEQFNKDFVKQHFDSGKGARWKVSGNPNADNGLRYIRNDLAAYKSRYGLKSKDSPKVWKDLVELTRVINLTPAKDLEKALEPILDVDGTLWFLAVDVASANSDGYWTRASDYSIYQNKKGKFHILPHDMNEAFGLAQHGGGGGPGGGGPGGGGPPGFGPPGGGFGPPGRNGPPGASGPASQRDRGNQRGGRGDDRRGGDQRGGRGDDRRFGGRGGGRRGGPGGGDHGGPDLDPLVGLDNDRFPLRSKLLANENMKKRYLQHLHTIATDYLNWQYLGPKVAAARKLIDAEVKADTRKLMTYKAFLEATDDKDGTIRKFCDERAKYLLQHPAIKSLK